MQRTRGRTEEIVTKKYIPDTITVTEREVEEVMAELVKEWRTSRIMQGLWRLDDFGSEFFRRVWSRAEDTE